MNTKRILCILLTVLLLLCMFPVSAAFAADKTSGELGENIEWRYKNHTLTLSGKGEMEDCYDRLDYPWYALRTSIKKLVVKDGITSIAYGAFYQYKNLSVISLADSVMDVDGNAFFGTAWYKSQKKGVLYLNQIACGYRGNMPGDYALKIKSGTKAIGTSAFERSDNLRSVSIPDSVTYIGDSAFGWCEQLENVKAPQTLQYVGESAFSGTSWFDNQPDGMVYLGKVAYRYHGEMSANTNIKIKSGTVSISPNAFYYEESLTGIRIPESVTTIGAFAFYGANIDKLRIPKSVIEIQDNRLGAYFSKKIIVDPENPSYSSDETGALFNKNKTQMYEYPGANKTKTYRIPNTVRRVHTLCFAYTQFLNTLIIPKSVKVLEIDAVDHTCYISAFQVDKNNPHYSSDQAGCLYNKNKTTLIRYPVGRKASSFTVPKQVKTIGRFSFMEANNLHTLIMSDNVTTIGEFAINRCFALENIRFSKNITCVEGSLCGSNPWLENQPDGVVYIGKVAYQLNGCVKKVTIKSGTVSIVDYAFSNTDCLQSVVIPKSVKTIGCCAFADSVKTIQINNPKCAFLMEKDTFPKKATLFAAKGSTTQAYAEAFGRTFVAI